MVKRLFGQYVNKGSFIHKLDPRLKIIFLVILSIALFLVKSLHNIIFSTIFIFLITIISRLKLKYVVKSLKPFIAIILFIMLMYYFFSRNQIMYGLIAIWRFIMLLIIALLLTSTTTVSNLVNAIESLLKPLKALKLHPRNISLMLSITIRFIPALFLYADKVNNAQLSRCGDKKMRNVRLFVLKILDRMISSANVLSEAIISRCYNGNATRKQFSLKIRDYLALAVVTIFCFILFFTSFFTLFY